ncbi:hypothetical protein EGW08_013167 [Elysia chlorotica]|uniref:Uncharacterized protein n=1 Tax=Elysia chlorotica TaxID=188477 RepID=A0A3S1BEP4_ELYCH|nr:hypothetical protein EGW08_013167 [Elysia chlorotica]
MRIPTCVLLSCLACLGLDVAQGADIVLCQQACGTPPEKTSESTLLLQHLCGCIKDATSDPFAFLDKTTPTDATTSPPPTTTKAPTLRYKITTTTAEPVTSICDYLCAHQMGGDACRCSNPSLPGK